jgi:hypothetical protein
MPGRKPTKAEKANKQRRGARSHDVGKSGPAQPPHDAMNLQPTTLRNLAACASQTHLSPGFSLTHPRGLHWRQLACTHGGRDQLAGPMLMTRPCDGLMMMTADPRHFDSGHRDDDVDDAER